jgi:hypothetical protein
MLLYLYPMTFQGYKGSVIGTQAKFPYASDPTNHKYYRLPINIHKKVTYLLQSIDTLLSPEVHSLH